VPTLDSINRFLSASDQSNLWQKPDFNQYHANYETGHGGYKFGTLFTFDQALTNRYGQWSASPPTCRRRRCRNYENTRAQFEAFLDHSTNAAARPPARFYWQANRLADAALGPLQLRRRPGRSFFGAKKPTSRCTRCSPIDNNTVTLDNLSGGTQPTCRVEARSTTPAERCSTTRRPAPAFR